MHVKNYFYHFLKRNKSKNYFFWRIQLLPRTQNISAASNSGVHTMPMQPQLRVHIGSLRPYFFHFFCLKKWLCFEFASKFFLFFLEFESSEISQSFLSFLLEFAYISKFGKSQMLNYILHEY